PVTAFRSRNIHIQREAETDHAPNRFDITSEHAALSRRCIHDGPPLIANANITGNGHNRLLVHDRPTGCSGPSETMATISLSHAYVDRYRRRMLRTFRHGLSVCLDRPPGQVP